MRHGYRSVYAHLSWTWSILGAVASSAALISLLQKIGDVELAEVPAQYLRYYRTLVATLTGWVPLPFEWTIPQWYADLMGLAGVLGATLMRTEKLAPLGPFDDYPYKPITRLQACATILLYTAFPPLVMIGLAIGIGKATYIGHYYEYRNEKLILAESLRTERGYPTAGEVGRFWQVTFLVFLIVSTGATLLFFLASGVLTQ